LRIPEHVFFSTCILSLLFVCLGSIPLGADSGTHFVPEDDKDEWVFAFSSLTAANLGPDFHYLSYSIPLLLIERFLQLPEHVMSDEEITGYRLFLIRRQHAELSSKLSEKLRSRDLLLFEQPESGTEYTRMEDEIALIRADLQHLQNIDPELIRVDPVKSAALIAENETGTLLSPPGPQIKRSLGEADLLIYGSASEVQGYVIIEISAYSRYAEQNIFSKTYAAEPENLDDEIRALAQDVTSVLLGRPWAALSVAADRDHAEISIDGEIAGYGSAELPFLKPGLHTVNVSAPDFLEYEETIGLMTGAERRLEIPMRKREGESVLISSEPEGADLYVDSIWAGRTPVTLTLPGQPRALKLSKAGYHSSTFALTPESPKEIERRLISDRYDFAAELEQEKDEFYTSLGLFVLSVPAPIILGGLYQNIVSLFPGGSPAAGLDYNETLQLIDTGNALYYSYLGSIIISGFFLVNVFINLFEYIDAGEAYHKL
jgi:hypothetical protein